MSKLKELNNKTMNIETLPPDFNPMVAKIVDHFSYIIEGPNEKRKIINYHNKYNITSKEIYDFISNNQEDSNSIVLLGDFNYYGIKTSEDKKKAFTLYQKAANLENKSGTYNLGYCYYNL